MPGAPIIETTADGTRKALDIALIRNGAYASVSITEDGRYRKAAHLTDSELNRFGDACKDFAAAMRSRRGA